MSRFRRDNRGQFVILAAVIIAAFLLSLVLAISHLSTSRLEVAYEPLDEAVLAITSDFERCLTRALAVATQKYNETWSTNLAKIYGNTIIYNWLKTLLEPYSSFGINITLVSMESGGSNVDWFFDWSKRSGVSYIYTTFGIDIGAYGLSGLSLTMQRAVYLNIVKAEIESVENDAFNILIIFDAEQRGNMDREPVQGLTKGNVTIFVNGEKVSGEDITELKYMGRGTYYLRFKCTRLDIKRIVLIAATGEGVRVGASTGLDNFLALLLSDDLSTPEPNDNGGYFIVNGVQHRPPHSFLLSPDETATISFTPPDGARFINFDTRGPLNLTPMDEPFTATINVLGGGLGVIIAYYNSSTVTAPTYCYLTLTSMEHGGNTTDLGAIELNGVKYEKLPVYDVPVLFNEPLLIKYYPDPGYVFKNWSSIGKISIIDRFSQSTYITPLENGTIIAVYEKSRPEDWQYLYISPENGGKGKDKDDFILTINKEKVKEKEIQPISYGQMSREGGSEYTTPELYLGDMIKITLYAKASSQDVHLNVTFGFYDINGSPCRIGSGRIIVSKSNRCVPYEISFKSEMKIIPRGSTFFLIFERTNTDPGGGTLHILCGPEKSKIILW